MEGGDNENTFTCCRNTSYIVISCKSRPEFNQKYTSTKNISPSKRNENFHVQTTKSKITNISVDSQYKKIAKKLLLEKNNSCTVSMQEIHCFKLMSNTLFQMWIYHLPTCHSLLLVMWWTRCRCISDSCLQNHYRCWCHTGTPDSVVLQYLLAPGGSGDQNSVGRNLPVFVVDSPCGWISQ